MKKFNPGNSNELREEQEALVRKRSTALPHIPDFSAKLAQGEIQNLLEDGRFPVEAHLKKFLSGYYSRQEIMNILRHPKVREALEMAELATKVTTFKN